jgi:hypothetical protein
LRGGVLWRCGGNTGVLHFVQDDGICGGWDDGICGGWDDGIFFIGGNSILFFLGDDGLRFPIFDVD